MSKDKYEMRYVVTGDYHDHLCHCSWNTERRELKMGKLKVELPVYRRNLKGNSMGLKQKE